VIDEITLRCWLCDLTSRNVLSYDRADAYDGPIANFDTWTDTRKRSNSNVSADDSLLPVAPWLAGA